MRDLPLIEITEDQWLTHLMVHMPMRWKLDDCEAVLCAIIRNLGYTEIDAWTLWHGSYTFYKKYFWRDEYAAHMKRIEEKRNEIRRKENDKLGQESNQPPPPPPV